MLRAHHPVRLLFVSLLSLLTLTVNITQAAPPKPHTISIATARSLPLGSVVTVDGTISTPPGAFESSFFDKGFGLQDISAGIYVSVQTAFGLEQGERARVTGMLEDSAGLLILVPSGPSDVKGGEDGQRIRPETVATGAVGEATEGRIVRVTGTISQAPMSDLPYGYKLYVNDGSGEIRIYVNLQTHIDVSHLKLGQRVRVTGFSSQYVTPEIDPRSPDDIVVPER